MEGRYEIIKINPYEDKRGELKKVFIKSLLDSNNTIEEIYVLYTKKGGIRGNHYHKINIEFFTVIKGIATIALKDLDREEAAVFRVSEGDNTVIKVMENVAHSFRNDEEEELIILAAASKQYCIEDMDTYTYQLL